MPTVITALGFDGTVGSQAAQFRLIRADTSAALNVGFTLEIADAPPGQAATTTLTYSGAANFAAGSDTAYVGIDETTLPDLGRPWYAVLDVPPDPTAGPRPAPQRT